MFISRKEYNRIIERLDALEDATRCPTGYPDTKLGRVVQLLLHHLGLTIERPLPYDRLVQKGGPEAPQTETFKYP